MDWKVRASNPGGGEIFRTCPDRPWGPPSLLYNRYRVFPGGKERPGRDGDPSPPSSAVVMKEQSYTSTPPMGRTACTEPQCLYKGTLYLTSYCTESMYSMSKDMLQNCSLNQYEYIFTQRHKWNGSNTNKRVVRKVKNVLPYKDIYW